MQVNSASRTESGVSERFNRNVYKERNYRMKKKLLLAMTLVLAASTSFAGFLDKETQSVRADYVYDDEAGKDSAHGLELGVGSSLYEMDDVAVYFQYFDNDSMQAQRLGVSFEEYWEIPNLPLRPFGGVALGWGWMDPTDPQMAGDAPESSSFYLGFEGGLNLELTSWFALSGSAEYLWADRGIFLNEDLTRDDGSDWNFKLGVRFYY